MYSGTRRRRGSCFRNCQLKWRRLRTSGNLGHNEVVTVPWIVFLKKSASVSTLNVRQMLPFALCAHFQVFFKFGRRRWSWYTLAQVAVCCSCLSLAIPWNDNQLNSSINFRVPLLAVPLFPQTPQMQMHTRMSDVAEMNEACTSCLTWEWVTTRTISWVDPNIWHVCHVIQWLVPSNRIWMSHGTHVNAVWPSLTCEMSLSHGDVDSDERDPRWVAQARAHLATHSPPRPLYTTPSLLLWQHITYFWNKDYVPFIMGGWRKSIGGLSVESFFRRSSHW